MRHDDNITRGISIYFLEVIRKIPKFKNASDQEIKSPLCQFLAGAKFRQHKKLLKAAFSLTSDTDNNN